MGFLVDYWDATRTRPATRLVNPARLVGIDGTRIPVLATELWPRPGLMPARWSPAMLLKYASTVAAREL